MRYLQREALRDQLNALIEQLRGEIAQGLKLPNHNEETDDQAVADVETEIEVAAIERATRTLREAVATLERLYTPDYGLCAHCGAEIPYMRLHANPIAKHCIDCQRALERAAPAPATL